MNIAILGGGSWGTALAVHLARNKNSVKVWEFLAAQAEEMQRTRVCPLLPGVMLPPKIFISSEMREVLTTMDVVLVAVPSTHVEETLRAARPWLGSTDLILCSKGFSPEGKLLSTVAGSFIKGKVYCLYGPTHAEEVCREMLSGVVLAGPRGGEKYQRAFASEAFKVELSNDVVGVQVSAALKNVVATFVGVLDGLGLGDNAKAYVITKGLEEIRQVGLAMGARAKTFEGLAGMGDLVVTCFSRHSRNHYLGVQVGKGRKVDEVLAEMKMVVEGVTAAKRVIWLEKKYKLHLPLLRGLYHILFENKSPREVLRKL